MQHSITYKDAGVNIEEGDLLIEKIKPYAKSTLRKEVLAGIGGFGAMFEIGKKYIDPVLVSGTDGVGTKLKLAFEFNKHDTIGIDLVAMSVNDILVQGAEPLFFLDYFACGKLNVDKAASVIKGIALGCNLSGCSLIGGETAEMPGMYPDNEYDLAGFAVGVVEKSKIIDGSKVAINDVIIGVESSGLHSNGYSLIRHIINLQNLDLQAAFNHEMSWGELLLTPTTIYVKPVLKLLENYEIHAMAHITGGGLTGNIPRVIPDYLSAVINLNNLPKKPLFEWIKLNANLNTFQMLETFNCGIGFAIIVQKELYEIVEKVFSEFNLQTHILGTIKNTATNQKIIYE